MIRIVFLTFFTWLIIVGNAFSDLEFNDAVFPELVASARALAMGNAFMNKVDDPSASFYNPAGLGTVRYATFHLNNVQLELNRDWFKLSSRSNGLEDFGSFYKSFDADYLRRRLLANTGKSTYGRIQFSPNLTSRYFTLGFLASKRSKAYLGNETTDLFQYRQRVDVGPYIGMNISLLGGVLKLGATAVFLRRKEAFKEQNRQQTFNLVENDFQKGSMNYIISAVRLTLPIRFIPTFSARVNNSGNKDFQGSDAPDKIQSTTDFAFSLTPRITSATTVHMEINYKDAFKKYTDIKTKRKWNTGLEVDYMRKVFFRLGYADGFGSFGFGIASKTLRCDITSYAIDKSDSSFRGEQERRFIFSLSSGI